AYRGARRSRRRQCWDAKTEERCRARGRNPWSLAVALGRRQVGDYNIRPIGRQRREEGGGIRHLANRAALHDNHHWLTGTPAAPEFRTGPEERRRSHAVRAKLVGEVGNDDG